MSSSCCSKMLAALFVAILAIHPSNARGDADFTAYYVGNSLSGQTSYTVPTLAASRSENFTSAIHLKCGASLSNILANPTDTCIAPDPVFGYFGNALPNFHWDAVTIEPYGDAYNDGRQSASALIDLTRQNPANSDTRFYYLSVWPQGLGTDSFATRFDRAYDSSVDDPESRWSRQYALSLFGSIRADNPNVTLGMVPVGQVLYVLDGLARSGQIESFHSADELYKDSAHLGPEGAWIAGLTWDATVFRESPVGLPLVNAPTSFTLSDSDRQLIQQTVCDVVTSNSDLTLVPEPSSFIAVGMLGGLFMTARRRRS